LSINILLDGTALSYDMSEGEFFGVNGEENGGDYQYDIYRMMRDEVNRLKYTFSTNYLCIPKCYQ
jgi:hypothetical protein